MGLRFAPRPDYRSWGGVIRAEHQVARLTNRDLASAALKDDGPFVAYGAGRSYGDVARFKAAAERALKDLGA